jgi:hypothetical protein
VERPDASNVLLVEKRQSKRLFRKAVRTEIAEQRNKERELMSTFSQSIFLATIAVVLPLANFRFVVHSPTGKLCRK